MKSMKILLVGAVSFTALPLLSVNVASLAETRTVQAEESKKKSLHSVRKVKKGKHRAASKAGGNESSVSQGARSFARGPRERVPEYTDDIRFRDVEVFKCRTTPVDNRKEAEHIRYHIGLLPHSSGLSVVSGTLMRLAREPMVPPVMSFKEKQAMEEMFSKMFTKPDSLLSSAAPPAVAPPAAAPPAPPAPAAAPPAPPAPAAAAPAPPAPAAAAPASPPSAPPPSCKVYLGGYLSYTKEKKLQDTLPVIPSVEEGLKLRVELTVPAPLRKEGKDGLIDIERQGKQAFQLRKGAKTRPELRNPLAKAGKRELLYIVTAVEKAGVLTPEKEDEFKYLISEKGGNFSFIPYLAEETDQARAQGNFAEKAPAWEELGRKLGRVMHEAMVAMDNEVRKGINWKELEGVMRSYERLLVGSLSPLFNPDKSLTKKGKEHFAEFAALLAKLYREAGLSSVGIGYLPDAGEFPEGLLDGESLNPRRWKRFTQLKWASLYNEHASRIVEETKNSLIRNHS